MYHELYCTEIVKRSYNNNESFCFGRDKICIGSILKFLNKPLLLQYTHTQ